MLNLSVLLIPKHPQKLGSGFGNRWELDEDLIEPCSYEALIEIKLLARLAVAIWYFVLFFSKPLQKISYFLLVGYQISKLIAIFLQHCGMGYKITMVRARIFWDVFHLLQQIVDGRQWECFYFMFQVIGFEVVDVLLVHIWGSIFVDVVLWLKLIVLWFECLEFGVSWAAILISSNCGLGPIFHTNNSFRICNYCKRDL